MSLIPEKLRQDHEDGKVVFFCGAGVSMPAGLSSFERLVKQVLEGLAPSERKEPLPWKAFNDKKFDEVLDILERHTRGGFGGGRSGRKPEKFCRKSWAGRNLKGSG